MCTITASRRLRGRVSESVRFMICAMLWGYVERCRLIIIPHNLSHSRRLSLSLSEVLQGHPESVNYIFRFILMNQLESENIRRCLRVFVYVVACVVYFTICSCVCVCVCYIRWTYSENRSSPMLNPEFSSSWRCLDRSYIHQNANCIGKHIVLQRHR